MNITEPIDACLKCGGEVYDNEGRKQSAKSPDFKCKDRDNCGEAFWYEKKGGNGRSMPAKQGNGFKPAAPKAKLPIRQYMENATKLLKFAHSQAEEAFGSGYDHEDARSLFIQASKDGYIQLIKVAAPAPKPEPEPEVEPDGTGFIL